MSGSAVGAPRRVTTLALAGACASAATAFAQSPPALIPLEALFDAPTAAWGGISPDGHWLSYLKDYHGRLNVYVRAPGSGEERPVTRDTLRSVPFYRWNADSRRIIYLQDKGGDESFHLFVAGLGDVDGARDLTPFKNVEVEVIVVPARTPNTILITLNKRDPRFADAYRVDLTTGALEAAGVAPRAARPASASEARGRALIRSAALALG